MRTRRPRPPAIARSAFAGFCFPPEVILLAVRWYLRFALSYRDVEELLAEREPQSPEEWELWLRTTRMAIRKQHVATGNGQNDQRLIHTSCQRRTTDPAGPALLPATPA